MDSVPNSLVQRSATSATKTCNASKPPDLNISGSTPTGNRFCGWKEKSLGPLFLGQQVRQGGTEGGIDGLTEKHEADQLRSSLLLQKGSNGGEGAPGGQIQGVAISPGRKGRKGHTATAVLGDPFQTVSISAGQQIFLVALPAAQTGPAV